MYVKDKPDWLKRESLPPSYLVACAECEGPVYVQTTWEAPEPARVWCSVCVVRQVKRLEKQVAGLVRVVEKLGEQARRK